MKRLTWHLNLSPADMSGLPTVRQAFCLYRSDWGFASASSSHTDWISPISQLAHSDCAGSIAFWDFGFPQQLGSVDPRLKIRQIILWCSRPVWESLPSSTVVHFWSTEQSFCQRLLWFPSLLNNSELMNGATLWLHKLSFSGRGSAHGWCAGSERGGEEEGESQADHS